MKFQHIIIFIAFLIPLVLLQEVTEIALEDDHWDYKEKGPETGAWCNVSKICCTGARQSPFVITPTTSNGRTSFDKSFELIDYDKGTELLAVNNGKTVVYLKKADSEVSPKIIIPSNILNILTKFPKSDRTYVFHSFQFHWGSDDSFGSEHKCDEINCTLEVQLVHYKSTFDKYEDAVQSDDRDALVIISLLYSTKINTIQRSDTRPMIQRIVYNSLPKLVKPGDTTTQILTLYEFFEHRLDVNSISYYYGSLTNPPCKEIVIWGVLGVAREIKPNEMAVFRSLEGKGSTKLSNNFRPLNPLRKLKQMKKNKKGKFIIINKNG